MKRKVVCFTSILVVSCAILSGCHVNAASGPETNAASRPETNAAESSSNISLDDSVFQFDKAVHAELELVDSEENDSGKIVNTYSDGTYYYCVFEGAQDVYMISMQPDAIEQLEEKYSGEIITKDEATDLCLKFIKLMYPSYGEVKITCDDETGINSEYFRFSVEEVNEAARINIAQVGMAYDGTITFSVGSHNEQKQFDEWYEENSSTILPKDNLADLVAKYVIENNNDDITDENSIDIEPLRNETITLKEGDAIPDGYKVGDVIEPTQLPSFQLLLEDGEDIDGFSAIIVRQNDRYCYECTGEIKTNWGEYDSILNLGFDAIVDAETGEMISFMTCDGE